MIEYCQCSKFDSLRLSGILDWSKSNGANTDDIFISLNQDLDGDDCPVISVYVKKLKSDESYNKKLDRYKIKMNEYREWLKKNKEKIEENKILVKKISGFEQEIKKLKSQIK